MNKTRKIITGFTGNEINLSEGYLAKLQKRAAQGAESFCDELRAEILKQKLVYWDDTVIMINKMRAYLREMSSLRFTKLTCTKTKRGLMMIRF